MVPDPVQPPQSLSAETGTAINGPPIDSTQTSGRATDVGLCDVERFMRQCALGH